MNEQDFELLQRFVRRGDQGAFEALVRRHLDLVYATAWRKLEDSGAAEEVTQNVFAALGRKAWQFASDSSLPAWLHRCTLLEAKTWLRGELRRRRREEAAVELGTTMKTPDDQSAVRALIPLLDEALLSLREPDRAALLLRYYETRSFRDVGATLGVREDAAQKRVARAVERLARFFQLRGYKTATVAAMVATLHHTAVSAPDFLVASVTRAALPCGASALIGSKALLAPLVTLTKLQKAAVFLVLLLTPLTVHMVRNTRAAALPLQTQQQVAPSNLPAVPPSAAFERRLDLPLPSQAAEPAASNATPRTRRSPQTETEYSVELRGLVELPDWKGALLAVHHHSLNRPNGPPFVAKRLLRLGDAFDDRSVRGNYLRLELLLVDAQSGNAGLRLNGAELNLVMEGLPQTAPSQIDAPPALLLTAPGFTEPLELYGELIERTVLCHPAIKQAAFSFAGRALDSAEAARILEQTFRERGVVIAREGEHLALAVPSNLVKTVTAQLRDQPSNPWSFKDPDGLIPRGAIYLENAELTQVLAIYGELIGRKLVKDNIGFRHTISFRSQTSLSKSETVHAFDILLLWQGLKAIPVGERDFRVTTAPYR